MEKERPCDDTDETGNETITGNLTDANEEETMGAEEDETTGAEEEETAGAEEEESAAMLLLEQENK